MNTRNEETATLTAGAEQAHAETQAGDEDNAKRAAPKRSSRLRLSPFMMDILLTTGTAIITGISLVMVSYFLARGLTPEEFGVYSIARRVFFTLGPCCTISMNLAIARYVATTDDWRERYQLLWTGLVVSLLPCILLCLVCWPFKQPLGVLIFQSPLYTAVIPALLLSVIGNSFYQALYAFYRGSGSMRRANVWQLIVVAIGPMLAAMLLAGPGRVATILVVMGWLYMLAAVPLAILLIRNRLAGGFSLDLRKYLHSLVAYGSGRAAGSLVLAAIFSCGPVMAPWFGTLKDAAYLSAGQSVLSLAEAGLVAFGLVVLPKAAQLAAKGQEEFLRHRVGDITVLILHIGIFITVQVAVWSDVLVIAWLGPKYAPAISIVRILMLSIIPYLSYVMLRSIVDAVEDKAANTANLLFALLVNLGVAVLLGRLLGSIGVAIGNAAGFLALGLSTVFYLYRKNWIVMQKPLLAQCLAFNLIAAVLAVGFKAGLSNLLAFGTKGQLVAGLLIEFLLFAVYCYMLYRLKATWIEQIALRVIGGRQGGSSTRQDPAPETP